MTTKMLLIVPLAAAIIAGCADTTRQSPQASANCANLTGAALADCQKSIEPAARTATDRQFKMVKPKPVNGNFRGGMDDGARGVAGN